MRLRLNNNQKKPTLFTKTIKLFKQLFGRHDHLAKYLPLMTETKENRICRIIGDNSQSLPAAQHPLKLSVPSLLFPRLRIFSPTQTLMLIWYWLVFWSIMYYYIQMGLVLTYGNEVWQDQISSPLWITVDVITILVFFLDLLVLLNCGFLYRGMVIMDAHRIAAQFVRKYAVVDVVAIVIVVLCPATKCYDLNFTKLWLILKVRRLFQIDDFYLRKLNIHRKSKALYVIFKLVVIIFLLSHMVGLIFYAMDQYICDVAKLYQTQFCWLYSSTAFSPINSLSYPLQYLYTLYWGINTITTISYGDIAPNNPIQVNYVIVCFCFGFMVYGYVVNQIVKVILWAREHQDQFKGQIVLMDTYMQKMKVSRDLRKNVYDYLLFLYNQEKNRDLDMEAKMIQKIPEELRIQLLKHAYQVFYSKLLSIFWTPDIIRIFFYLSQKKFTYNEPILAQNNRPTDLFYLSKGKGSFYIKHGTVQTKIYETQSQNQMIGHYQLFMRERWGFSVVTSVSSLVYSIDRLKIMEEINDRGRLRERFKLVEALLLFRGEVAVIFYNCYFCKKQHHYLNCPDKFPTFCPKLQSTQFPLSIPPESMNRRQKQRRNTLLHNKQLDQLRNLKKLNNYGLIARVEKRLAKIKRKIEERSSQFQIDLVHDWQLYYTQDNLSKIREKWNSGLTKSMSLNE